VDTPTTARRPDRCCAEPRRGRAHQPDSTWKVARRPLPVPARIATAAELDALIRRLQALLIDLPYTEFDIVIGED
jgi:hypothetical protein